MDALSSLIFLMEKLARHKTQFRRNFFSFRPGRGRSREEIPIPKVCLRCDFVLKIPSFVNKKILELRTNFVSRCNSLREMFDSNKLEIVDKKICAWVKI